MATSVSTGGASSSRRVPPGRDSPSPARRTVTGCTVRTGGSAASSGSTGRTIALVAAYHRFLVWDIVRRPLLTRLLERVLDPLIGKSLVLYFTRSP